MCTHVHRTDRQKEGTAWTSGKAFIQGFKVLLSFLPLGARKQSYIHTRHSLLIKLRALRGLRRDPTTDWPLIVPAGNDPSSLLLLFFVVVFFCFFSPLSPEDRLSVCPFSRGGEVGVGRRGQQSQSLYRAACCI